MSKKRQYIIILLVLLLFVMWVFNPTSGRFVTYIKKIRHIDPSQKLSYIPGRELVTQKIRDQMSTGELEYDLVKRIVFNYKSFLFFSKATFVEDRDSSNLEIRYFYIGVFDHFIPIGFDIPIYTSSKSSSNTYLPHPSDSIVEKVQGWKYVDHVDEQTGGNIHVASIESRDSIELRPQKEGGSGSLIMRNMRGRSQVFLTLNERQFVSDIPTVGIGVSVDNGEIDTWSCDTVGGSHNSVIIILRSLKFISKIKKAKNLRINADVFGNGIQQMEFNVGGLEWEQKK